MAAATAAATALILPTAQPVHAATVTGVSLEWGYSRYAQYGTSGQWNFAATGSDDVSITTRDGQLVSGLAEDAGREFKLLNFHNGVADVQPDGAMTITWDTDALTLNAHAPVVGAPTNQFASPILTLDAAGNGTLSFEVTIPPFEGMGGGAGQPTTRIVLATFTGADASGSEFTLDPEFVGRVPGNAPTYNDCTGAGGSWPQEWLDFVSTSERSYYFTTSCTGANLRKPPLPVSIDLAGAELDVPKQGSKLTDVTFEWTGNEEMQSAPPFGGSNYFSAGKGDGTEATYAATSGNVSIWHVDGATRTPASYATRAVPATSDVEQLVSISGGKGEVAADGSVNLAWNGTWTVNFYGGIAPFTLTDPELSIDAEGDGALTVEVQGCASSQANPMVCTPLEAERVTLATFHDVNATAATGFAVAPDFAGVTVTLPAGVDPQDTTTPGWGAWPQSFVDYHIETGLHSYWYTSGSGFDALKPPADFWVGAATIAPKQIAPVTAVTPARYWDTRDQNTFDGQHRNTGRLAERAQYRVTIAGRGGVPADAVAVSANVTAILPDAAGFATLFPCTTEVPLASHLNYVPGEIVANGAVVPLDGEGGVCVFTRAAADFVLDVTGFVDVDASTKGIQPARYLDTRTAANTITFDGQSQGGGTVAAGQMVKVRIGDRGAVPAGTQAALVNLTVVGPQNAGYLTLYPCGERPRTSTVNYLSGQNVPNGAIAPLDANGDVCIFTSAAADIVLDVTGYVPAGDESITTATPVRVYDSRPGEPTFDNQPAQRARLAADSMVEVPLAARLDLPEDATAVLLNVAVVTPDAAGYLTLYPCGERPLASTVNHSTGGVLRANNAVIPLSHDGSVCIYTKVATDVVLDLTGYVVE